MNTDQSLDAVLEKFDANPKSHEEKKPGTTLSLWVPTDYKEKYDKIQTATKGEFSSTLAEIVKLAIDRKFQPTNS